MKVCRRCSQPFEPEIRWKGDPGADFCDFCVQMRLGGRDPYSSAVNRGGMMVGGLLTAAAIGGIGWWGWTQGWFRRRGNGTTKIASSILVYYQLPSEQKSYRASLSKFEAWYVSNAGNWQVPISEHKGLVHRVYSPSELGLTPPAGAESAIFLITVDPSADTSSWQSMGWIGPPMTAGDVEALYDGELGGLANQAGYGQPQSFRLRM